MALALSHGLTPAETAFLCEMELVTIIPRQRLESLQLLGGPTPILRPPHRANLPFWLALLLKRQRRADIVPPPWLHHAALTAILDRETNPNMRDAFSDSTPLPLRRASANTTPPFQPCNTADASERTLPYHWLEIGQTLLAAASDDITDAEAVRRLLRDLREVRMAKVRAGVGVLEAGAGVRLNGLGAMEVGEGRAFLGGVVDGLRRLGASREVAAKERAEEERDVGGARGSDDDDDVLMS